jgi:GT2 family glycosyltransferase
MNASFPSVGIGILNWNGLEFLKALLPEIEKLTYSNYTIYVIDNKSSDDSIGYIKTFHPSVTIIALDQNYGFASGYNKGFAFMEEDYYLMMNSDVEVPADFIEPLVEMMESDKEIAICQPKLIALQDKTMLEHGGAAGGMIDMLGYPFCRGRLFETTEADKGQYQSTAQIFWASGAACLIRKEAFRKVNGMYDYFFMHSEEIDMSWRLISEGYKIMYCPNSFIYHLGGGTLAYKSPRKTYLNFRNNIIMCFRNSPWYINLWLMPLRVCLDIIAAIRFLVAEDSANFSAVFIAHKDFLRWLFTEKNKFPPKKKSLISIPVVLKNSIVWQHYIKEIKYYNEL